MASEYLKKLAREQAPREEKRELTPEEKRRNWWDYHKWYVAAAAAALVLLGLIVRDVFFNRDPEPDYQVAYVGSAYLPEDTGAALASALAELGEDLNGDGQVLVKVAEYPLFADEAAGYQTGMAAQVQLTVDLSNNESFFFLMEDPARVQEQLELLAYPDGTVPAAGEAPSEELWYAWTDCPVLTGLELGEYTEDTLDGTVTGDNQELLSELYIARRVFTAEDEAELLPGWEALWAKLLEGAT
ncbi:MAG: hypothetical protein IJ375_06765 [Oscillospiraceae bacterium]|nr:hypothetical protein [Oscillospiraceae bacterium]